MATRRMFALAVCSLAFTSAVPRASAQDIQRGLRNYNDVVSGRKRLQQLTAQERSEVLLVARRMDASRGGGKSSECREALERAEEAASDLTDSTRRLMNCAESEDYEDDCSSEFSSVRNDHSDYEDAVSEVQSECS